MLDELGYLPFAQSGGQLLSHLVSKLYELTSVIVTTNLTFRTVFRDTRSSRQIWLIGLALELISGLSDLGDEAGVRGPYPCADCGRIPG